MRMLHYFITIVLVTGYVAAAPEKESRALIEDIVAGMLECARGMLEEGVPEIGFPSLKNLTIPSMNLNLNELSNDFFGYLYVEDFEFAGLTEYKVNSVDGNIGIIPPSYTVDMMLDFPRPILYSKYKTDFQSPKDDLDVYGEGVVQFDAYHFVTRIRTKVVVLFGISMDYFEFWPTMQGLNSFTITGVRNDEEYSLLVTDYVKANGPFIVADLSGRINEVVGEVILGMYDGGVFTQGSLIYHLFSHCL